jgi:hypothetical protein
MKKIQISIAAFAALIAAGFTTSFRLPSKHGYYQLRWFRYMGTRQTSASFNNPANYAYTAILVCLGTGKLCGIQVTATTVNNVPIIYAPGGKFGAPLGTNIASSLSLSGTYSATGANGIAASVMNKN